MFVLLDYLFVEAPQMLKNNYCIFSTVKKNWLVEINWTSYNKWAQLVNIRKVFLFLNTYSDVIKLD